MQRSRRVNLSGGLTSSSGEAAGEFSSYIGQLYHLSCYFLYLEITHGSRNDGKLTQAGHMLVDVTRQPDSLQGAACLTNHHSGFYFWRGVFSEISTQIGK